MWILIPARRRAFYNLADFQHASVDPLAHRLVVVKLDDLFPELRDIAPCEILTLSPGCADLNLPRLPFEHVVRPIYPARPELAMAATVSAAPEIGVGLIGAGGKSNASG